MTQDGPGSVIVLTGPCGAGKSTVARLITDRLKPSVHLHTDDFYTCIRQGFIPPYLPESHRQNEVVLGVLSGCAFGYAAGGYHVVLDGVVGPWSVQKFRTAVEQAAIPLSYVILRPELDVVMTRATGRGPEALTEPGPVRQMYEQFTRLGEYEPYTFRFGSAHT
ncbi:AAA family ATPase [Actinomadura sp. NTSP31]|uniref:AAA family ATPase n=1 Tax=Actinomadura sp. NTSP31 TaxID=1735447 RepID=UPI0035C06435